MVLPHGYELRPPVPDDLEPIAGVLAADDLADAGHVTLDAGFLEDEWRRPGFDLAGNAMVVTRDGVAVAYAQALHEEAGVVDSWGVVHPEHRGRGLGSAILDRIEERASELLTGHPQGRFRHAINANDAAAAAMLRERDLRVVRHFWHMRVDLGPMVGPLPEPPGIAIAPVSPPADLPRVHAVIMEAFAGGATHHVDPFDRWLAIESSTATYDPALWLIATEGADAVGALTAQVQGDRGWVRELGVVPGHRGRGIGAALLRRAFAALAGRGVREAFLNVDAENPTGATAVYEGAGMQVVKRWDLWERPASRD